MRAVGVIAGKELRDGLRNRWVAAISVLFALFAVGLAWFGGAASGHVGFTQVSTTIVSLATLAVFLIPLIALLLAYDAIVGEEERGTLLLLLSYPVSRTELVLGKLLGHAAILGGSTVLGFGAAAVIIAVLADGADVAELTYGFGLFIGSALLLGWVFLGVAYLISAVASEKARAAGLALVVWFLVVLVYDLALLAVLAGTGGAVPPGLFQTLMLLNPTDVFRLVNLTGFEAAGEHAGLAGIADETFPVAVLLGVLAVWVVIPVLLTLWRFQRRRL